MTPGVVVDLGAGHALVGERVLPVAPAAEGPAGALAVRGTVIRPLRFGERLCLVADAPDDARALAAAVLAAACPPGPTPPPAERAALEALALHLAGARAGEDPAPGFATCAGLMSRAFGWGAEAVVDVEASVVDRLASAVAGALPADGPDQGDDDGWTRIVLAPAPGASGADDDRVTSERVRDDLARDLLRRGAEPFVAVPLSPAGALQGIGSEAPDVAAATAIARPDRERPAARQADVVPDHPAQDATVANPSAQPVTVAGAGPEPRPDPSDTAHRTAVVGARARTAPATPAPAAHHVDDPAERPTMGRQPWPEPIASGPAWRPTTPPARARAETPDAVVADHTRPSHAAHGGAGTAAAAAPPSPAPSHAGATRAAPVPGAQATAMPSAAAWVALAGPGAAPAAPAWRPAAGSGPASAASAAGPTAVERAARHAPAPTQSAAPRESTAADVAALADHLAALLDDEADLRGIRP